MIGFQIRMQFLKGYPIEPLESVIRCAENLEKKIETNKPIKWYISSDDAGVIGQLRANYPDKVIYADGKIEHIGYGRENAENGFSRVVMDIELLAKTDELIVTSGSSFGIIASMKSGRLTHHIGRGDCQKMTPSNLGTRLEGFYAV